MKKLLTAFFALFMGLNASAATTPDSENTLLLELKDGTVEIQLLPEKAPKTVARIKELAGKGFYDGIIFHRVIDGFMAQTGDPTGTGRGGSGQKIPDEFPTAANSYTRGVVAMANAGPGTSDSQFFIMFADYPLPPGYTIFGKVTKGMQYVDKIARGEPPKNPDKIISMKAAAAAKK